MRALLPLRAVLILAALYAGASRPGDAEEEAAHAATMARAARGLLAILTPEQRRETQLAFEHPGRRRWRATPGRRVGLAWGRMNAEQRAAAEGLLRTGLSQEGLRRFRGIVTLEGILRAQAGAQVRRNPSWRDPGLYWVAIFGKPMTSGVWSWRIGGHHYTRHFTCVRGRVSAAPAFQGANPARVPGGTHRDLRVLAAEGDGARRVISSLGEKRRAQARSRQAPRDFVPYAPRRLDRLPKTGLRMADMGERAGGTLWALIEIWVGTLHPKLAEQVLAEARAERPGEIRFAWTGATQPGRGFGYRVQGPTFFFEFWHAGNHTHAVWRDPRNEHGTADLARTR